MGLFWNPYGGFLVDGRRLTKNEITLLKQTWSKQRRFSKIFFNWCWRKVIRIIKSFAN